MSRFQICMSGQNCTKTLSHDGSLLQEGTFLRKQTVLHRGSILHESKKKTLYKKQISNRPRVKGIIDGKNKIK